MPQSMAPRRPGVPRLGGAQTFLLKPGFSWARPSCPIPGAGERCVRRSRSSSATGPPRIPPLELEVGQVGRGAENRVFRGILCAPPGWGRGGACLGRRDSLYGSRSREKRDPSRESR